MPEAFRRAAREAKFHKGHVNEWRNEWMNSAD